MAQGGVGFHLSLEFPENLSMGTGRWNAAKEKKKGGGEGTSNSGGLKFTHIPAVFSAGFMSWREVSYR